MAMRRPGPQNRLSFDHHEAAAGTWMLPCTSEGQKGAVAVVGSLNMPGYPFIGEYKRFSQCNDPPSISVTPAS
jgi:hypothetical protein